MYIPAPAINWTNSPRFVRRSLFAEQVRIKRKPPQQVTADSTPGLLCWGKVGDLPKAEPVPEVGFVVQEHKEVSRETTPARIENPDDADQYVDVNQTKKMTLDKTVPAEKQNSATKDATSTEGTDDRIIDATVPATAATKTERYTVEYNPPERAV